MPSTTFRFHAELNDFLLPARRKQAFVVNCALNATVKHQIEALDITPLLRVRGWPLGQVRFVADAHLGGLARLLRLAGFDTL